MGAKTVSNSKLSRIWKKISGQGMSSLSKDEKNFVDEVANYGTKENKGSKTVKSKDYNKGGAVLPEQARVNAKAAKGMSKAGFKKGGMVKAGASNPPTQKWKKK